MNHKVILHSVHPLLDDYFRVDEAKLSYEKFDGSMTSVIRRLNFNRPDTAACLLYHTKESSILLVKQFRYPAYTKQEGWLFEIPAGVVDKGEKPEDTVCREVFEETGFSIIKPNLICCFFPSPGISSERCFLFSARTEEDTNKSEIGGLPEEQEDIKKEWIHHNNLSSMLSNQEIVDAKTIVAIQWFLLTFGCRNP